MSERLYYFPLKKNDMFTQKQIHTQHKREIRKEISLFFFSFLCTTFLLNLFFSAIASPFFSWIWDLNGAPCNDVLLYNGFFFFCRSLYMLDFFFHDDSPLLRLVNYRRPIYSNIYRLQDNIQTRGEMRLLTCLSHRIYTTPNSMQQIYDKSQK